VCVSVCVCVCEVAIHVDGWKDTVSSLGADQMFSWSRICEICIIFTAYVRVEDG